MSSWRCPHCGVAQPETSRCWVCQRSTTSCDTCRHYRRAVASGLGFCGLDRRRIPLLGDEMRPCWEAAATTLELDEPRDPAFARLAEAERPALAFVEVTPGSRGGIALLEREPEPEPASLAVAVAATEVPVASVSLTLVREGPAPSTFSPGWTLWGDAFL